MGEAAACCSTTQIWGVLADDGSRGWHVQCSLAPRQRPRPSGHAPTPVPRPSRLVVVVVGSAPRALPLPSKFPLHAGVEKEDFSLAERRSRPRPPPGGTSEGLHARRGNDTSSPTAAAPDATGRWAATLPSPPFTSWVGGRPAAGVARARRENLYLRGGERTRRRRVAGRPAGPRRATSLSALALAPTRERSQRAGGASHLCVLPPYHNRRNLLRRNPRVSKCDADVSRLDSADVTMTYIASSLTTAHIAF